MSSHPDKALRKGRAFFYAIFLFTYSNGEVKKTHSLGLSIFKHETYFIFQPRKFYLLFKLQKPIKPVVNIGTCKNNQVTYTIQGCLVDSVENGHWTVYDTAKKIVEDGQFDKGIRTGKWSYPLMLSNDTVIIWSKYENDSLKLVTNRPILLDDVRNGPTYTRWRFADTSKILSVVIETRDTVGLRLDIDSFYIQATADLIAIGFEVHVLDYRKLTIAGEDYLSAYEVFDSHQRSNIYSCYAIRGGHLIHVITRFENKYEPLARKIFESVSTSLYIDRRRFVNPLSSLESVSN